MRLTLRLLGFEILSIEQTEDVEVEPERVTELGTPHSEKAGYVAFDARHSGDHNNPYPE